MELYVFHFSLTLTLQVHKSMNLQKKRKKRFQLEFFDGFVFVKNHVFVPIWV